MAGHSKFKNIQFRKGRQDKLRSKLFSKLSRDITIAAKAGLPDPDANARLRLAIANAKAESMPKDNIDRAIKKGAGGDAESYDEVRYEGFGPGGVMRLKQCLLCPDSDRLRAAAQYVAMGQKRTCQHLNARFDRSCAARGNNTALSLNLSALRSHQRISELQPPKGQNHDYQDAVRRASYSRFSLRIFRG